MQKQSHWMQSERQGTNLFNILMQYCCRMHLIRGGRRISEGVAIQPLAKKANNPHMSDTNGGKPVGGQALPPKSTPVHLGILIADLDLFWADFRETLAMPGRVRRVSRYTVSQPHHTPIHVGNIKVSSAASISQMITVLARGSS